MIMHKSTSFIYKFAAQAVISAPLDIYYAFIPDLAQIFVTFLYI